MARNGHPRVPRKIRGERRRLERERAKRGYSGLAAWERELLRQRRPTVTIKPQSSTLRIHNDVIKDAYSPLLAAALGSPAEWGKFMADQG